MEANYTDPWALQEALMKASGQEISDTPVLNKTSLLYLALEFEELAEKCNTVHAIIKTCAEHLDTNEIANHAAGARNYLAMTSKALRAKIAEIGEFRIPLSTAQAVDLADGSADLAVVNCGFAVASGLKGADCYAETVLSNLSKRNPATGVIDKTPDGKWIKGPDYFKPNLGSILFPAAGDDTPELF